MSASLTLLGRHGAAWNSDSAYRLAWLVAPQTLGVVLILSMGLSTSRPADAPPNAVWAHPSDDRAMVAALSALRQKATADPAAEALLNDRAAAGNKVAQFFMGTLLDPMLDRARANPERTRRALEWYRKSAKQGVASAQANLGNLLSRSDLGLEPDYDEAFEWLQRAAPRMPAAERSLSFLYNTGQGVELNKAKAAELLRSAADRGDAIAERVLAEALDHGADGLTADPHEAVLLYQKAALKNDAVAERELASHLRSGRGVAADQQKALFWLRAAAVHGDAIAKAELAISEGNPAPTTR